MEGRGVVLVGSFIRKKNHTELGKEKNNPGHEGVFNFGKKKRNKKNPPLNARSKNIKTNKQLKKHALAAQRKKEINNTLKPLAAQNKKSLEPN